MTNDILRGLVQYTFWFLETVTLLLLPVLLSAGISRLSHSSKSAWALQFVRAAQQFLPDNSDKYDYAAKMLKSKFPGLKEEDIKAFIESAVHEVKTAVPDPPVVVIQNGGNPLAIPPQSKN